MLVHESPSSQHLSISTEAVDQQEQARLLSDGFLNSLALLASGVVGLVLTPLLVHGLGSELYGLWIAAGSAAAVVGLADAGLGWSLTREIARAETRDLGKEAERTAAAFLVNNIYLVYLFTGAAGSALIAVFGFTIIPRLHISPSSLVYARLVFLLAGVTFLASRLFDFGNGVLQGLRRYDVLSTISIAETVISASGMIALIFSGRKLECLAWWSFTSLGSAFLTIAVIGYLEPRYAVRPVRFSWNVIRPHLHFGLKSQLTTQLYQAGWRVVPLLVGFFGGPAAVTIYDVGQKFPSGLRAVSGQVSQVIYASASAAGTKIREIKVEEVVQAGLRSVLVITTPLTLTIAVFAPQLLRIWLGASAREAIWVLRVTLLAAWLESVGTVPLESLWGFGEATRLLAVTAASTAINLILSASLLGSLALVGAALGIVISRASMLAVLLYLVSRMSPGKWLATMAGACKGLGAPTAVCSFTLIASRRLLTADRVTTFGVVCALAVSAYAAALYSGRENESDRLAIAQLTLAPLKRFAVFIYHLLARVGFPWSAWQLALVRILANSAAHVERSFDSTFGEREDPFGFLLPQALARNALACRMLDDIRGNRPFRRVLEAGCAEGVVTSLLAARCESLLAVDVSSVALDRARARCAHIPHVRFALSNLRTERLVGKFDLVVAMDFLDYFYRPWDLRRACLQLANVLTPGGYLFVENYKLHYTYEGRWWAKYLLHGAQPIEMLCGRNRLLAEELRPHSL